jgi:hypothetical protein
LREGEAATHPLPGLPEARLELAAPSDERQSLVDYWQFDSERLPDVDFSFETPEDDVRARERRGSVGG